MTFHGESMNKKRPEDDMNDINKCELCGEPMPKGEEMFKFHGYSGNCPKPPIQKPEQKEIWLVLDKDGEPIHCASWESACHEHINDAINDHQIEGAEQWIVRRAELVPSA